MKAFDKMNLSLSLKQKSSLCDHVYIYMYVLFFFKSRDQMKLENLFSIVKEGQ